MARSFLTTLRYVAKRAGIDPEEIRIAVLQPPNMLAALQTKQKAKIGKEEILNASA